MENLYSNKLNLLAIAMLFFSIKGICQSTPPSSVSTMSTFIASGTDASGASGSVTYSIGQVFYTYMAESSYNVAQGVQQGNSGDRSLIVKNPTAESKVDVLIYPNPTVDFVNITIDADESFEQQRSYRLYDLQGRLLKQQAISQDDSQVNLLAYRSGIYILQVLDNSKILKTFKILKN